MLDTSNFEKILKRASQSCPSVKLGNPLHRSRKAVYSEIPKPKIIGKLKLRKTVSSKMLLLVDAIVTVGVVISGIIIYYTNWNIIDPLISFVIAAVDTYQDLGFVQREH
jgi:hypothetical protein